MNRGRITASLACILTAAVITGSWAANDKVGDVEAVSYLMGGTGLFDLDEVNETLNALGLGELGDWAGTFGGGGDLWIKRFLLGHQLTVGLWGSETSDNTEVSFKTAYWLAHAGLNILPRSIESVKLYPIVGVGAGIFGLKINANEFDFSQILNVEAQPDPLYQIQFLMSFGGGLDYTFYLRNMPLGVVVGTRVGYLLQIPKSDEWIRNSVEFENGPEQRLSSLYIQGIIGLKRTARWCRAKCK